eukprot:m.61270 g.61270  ORF g.61270 m.61270 type:complete len:891 (-) comp13329_c2_seq1:977-3649(-)
MDSSGCPPHRFAPFPNMTLLYCSKCGETKAIGTPSTSSSSWSMSTSQPSISQSAQTFTPSSSSSFPLSDSTSHPWMSSAQVLSPSSFDSLPDLAAIRTTVTPPATDFFPPTQFYLKDSAFFMPPVPTTAPSSPPSLHLTTPSSSSTATLSSSLTTTATPTKTATATATSANTTAQAKTFAPTSAPAKPTFADISKRKPIKNGPRSVACSTETQARSASPASSMSRSSTPSMCPSSPFCAPFAAKKDMQAQVVTSCSEGGLYASPEVYLFVDDSNIWIEGQKASARKHGIQDTYADLMYRDKQFAKKGNTNKLKHQHTIDPRFRVHLEGLLTLVNSHYGYIAEARLYGSVAAPHEGLWQGAKAKNFTVLTFDKAGKSVHGKEKEVDQAITSDISALATRLTTAAQYDAKRAMDKERAVIVLITGDRDMRPAIKTALSAGIQVRLLSFRPCISTSFLQLQAQNPNFQVLSLDDYLDVIGFLNFRSTHKVVDKARALVIPLPPNLSPVDMCYVLLETGKVFYTFERQAETETKQGKMLTTILVVEFRTGDLQQNINRVTRLLKQRGIVLPGNVTSFLLWRSEQRSLKATQTAAQSNTNRFALLMEETNDGSEDYTSEASLSLTDKEVDDQSDTHSSNHDQDDVCSQGSSFDEAGNDATCAVDDAFLRGVFEAIGDSLDHESEECNEQPAEATTAFEAMAAERMAYNPSKHFRFADLDGLDDWLTAPDVWQHQRHWRLPLQQVSHPNQARQQAQSNAISAGDDVVSCKAPEQQDDQKDGEWVTKQMHYSPERQHRNALRRRTPCRYGLHCKEASACPHLHSQEERNMFARYPKIKFHLWKSQRCMRIGIHDFKTCPFSHGKENNDRLWCCNCQTWDIHLTADCPVRKNFFQGNN